MKDKIVRIMAIVSFALVFSQIDRAGCLDDFFSNRKKMIQEQLEPRDIRDERVLNAMKKVLRHEFVPKSMRSHAYEDRPLPIGQEQTISQPYIVAKMTQAAEIKDGNRVLEIGTGSGYQAAVLAEIAKEVYTIEILKPLAERAKATLEKLGYHNIHVKHGDGFHGWPEKAPFDVILVTAAPEEVPPKLLEQLNPEGGRLIIPVGESGRFGAQPQKLLRIRRSKNQYDREFLLPVAFVPMTGEIEKFKKETIQK